MNAKAARALVEALHGGADQTAPGLPPIVLAPHDPRPAPELADDDREPGWGPSHVIKNGAALLGLTTGEDSQ